MVLCTSLHTMQTSLETVQGICMGEYAAATGGGGVGGGAATAATTAASSNSSLHSRDQQQQQQQQQHAHPQHEQQPATLSSKNRNNSRGAESLWSTATHQTTRTIPSDRFTEYPFSYNRTNASSIYQHDENENENAAAANDEDDLHVDFEQYKNDTAAFFASCTGDDWLMAPSPPPSKQPNDVHHMRVADLVAVDTEESSLRTPWRKQREQQQQQQQQQRPLVQQQPQQLLRQQDPQRHHHHHEEKEVDHEHEEHEHHHLRRHRSNTTASRSKRKKRPAYIVLYRPRTPWPLEKLDVVWTYQRIQDEESQSFPPPPSSVHSSRRRSGAGLLLSPPSMQLPTEPRGNSANKTITIMDRWTGLLQDEERVEIGRITGYNIHSSQQLDRLYNTNYGSGRQHKHVDPNVLQFAQTILNPTVSAAIAKNDKDGETQSPARPDMGPVLLITDVYVCPEYRGTGLGLFLVDVACRRVADPLALVVLACSSNPQQLQTQQQQQHPSEIIHLYFGLLGFAPISDLFLARRNGRQCPRVEEVCAHMPRNAVANTATTAATQTMAINATTGDVISTTAVTPRRRASLSLAPPS